ncbi:MAG: hypothetical protein ACPG5P_02815 [Saprospiraceae bacterium]
MKIQLWAVLLCSLFIGTSLIAQEKEKKKDLQTKSVSIFKNGTAFFIKEGKVKTEDNSYIMSKDIPRALFGTFWIHSPNDELKYVSSYKDYVTDKTEQLAVSFLDIIHANKGKKMKIHIVDSSISSKIHEGIVEEVVMKNAKGVETSVMNTNLIVFKTSSEWLTFSPSEIRRIEFLEKPNQLLERETTTQKNILEVKFNSAKKEQPLEMMYLEQGLNWTPTYLIELQNETSAKLSLRAEVTNGAEDIDNADMNFVVGIPNFKYANRLSSLVDFLGIIYPQNRNYATQTFSNTIVSPSVEYTEDVLTSGGSTFNTNLGNGVRGDGDEDLYFYNIRNITLKNGGRGQYPIFSNNVSIAHIYECNLDVNPSTGGYYQKEFLFSQDKKNPVFHSIKLKNNLEFPWTTGSAMVVSKKSGGTRPISQDLLKYTPIKGESYVKLTESTDIKVKHAEKEIDRKEKDKKVPEKNSSWWYDLVTAEGQIKIKSYKKKKVDLNIKRTIVGNLQESDVKWLKAERVNRSGNYNKTSDVCWETSINPGEELIIKYTYQIYIMRRY